MRVVPGVLAAGCLVVSASAAADPLSWPVTYPLPDYGIIDDWNRLYKSLTLDDVATSDQVWVVNQCFLPHPVVRQRLRYTESLPHGCALIIRSIAQQQMFDLLEQKLLREDDQDVAQLEAEGTSTLMALLDLELVHYPRAFPGARQLLGATEPGGLAKTLGALRDHLHGPTEIPRCYITIPMDRVAALTAECEPRGKNEQVLASLAQIVKIGRARQATRRLDLFAYGGTLSTEGALLLLATTQGGREVLRALLPRLESGKVVIRPATSAEESLLRRKNAAAITIAPRITDAGPRDEMTIIFSRRTKKVGELIENLAHEAVHATDETDIQLRRELRRSVIKYETLADGSPDGPALLVLQILGLDRSIFCRERRAYDVADRVRAELDEAAPCYTRAPWGRPDHTDNWIVQEYGVTGAYNCVPWNPSPASGPTAQP